MKYVIKVPNYRIICRFCD